MRTATDMRAHLIKPIHEQFAVEILFVNAWIFLVFAILLVVGRRRDPKEKIAARLERFEKNITVTETGEDATSYRFGMNISVCKQNFNLTKLIRDIGSFGASINSVADSDNPSFRTLNLIVPKWRFPLVRTLGVVIATTACLAGAYTVARSDIKNATDSYFAGSS